MQYESEQRQADYRADRLSIEHVIDTILDVSWDDPIVTWLNENSVKSATTFAVLTHQDIKTWTYRQAVDTGDDTTPVYIDTLLNFGQQVHILGAIWYLNHLGVTAAQSHRIIPYAALNRQTFQRFLSKLDRRQLNSVPNSNISPYENADLHSFRAGVKNDIDEIPTYRDTQHWEQWSCILSAECKSMHVDNILDHKYVPEPGNRTLFDAHNDFVYGIFERTVLTNNGQRIVQQHTGDRDAQAVYRKLCEQAVHHDLSVPADADTIWQYLENAKLDHWHGTSYDFLQHWLEQIRLAIGLPDAPFDDIWQGLTRDAVSTFPLLDTIPYSYKEEKFASDGTPYPVLTRLTFARYIVQLTSACIELDERQQTLDTYLRHSA